MRPSENIYPVILAGGAGERFWPCSRKGRAKQLLPLLSSKSLFEETLHRAYAIAPAGNIIVVTGRILEPAIRKIIGNRKCTVIAEPVGKNTAPAIAAAAACILGRNADGIMAVLSSDHRVSPLNDFVHSVKVAAAAAQKGHLVVFGIPPSRPDTGYGYIKFSGRLNAIAAPSQKLFKVEQFCEKPNAVTANKFLKSGKFLWNSGMFVWKASKIMDEIKSQMPKLYKLAERLLLEWGTLRQKSAIDTFYRKAPSQSIDYGIMEGASQVAVMKARFEWDDVGTWEALWRIRKSDRANNILHGLTISADNTNSLLYAENGLIVAAGLKDTVVVQSGNATLVVPRSYLPELKKIVALIKANKKLKRYL